MNNVIKKDLNNLIASKFVYLWASQVLSQLTINIMNFLLLMRLFSETSSSVATSFLWVSYALPAILIGPIASVVVDLYNKRRILMITNLLQAIVIFLYAISFNKLIFLPYTIAFLYSLFNQFYVPAEASYVPELADSKVLPRANSLLLLTQQTSLIIGFGFAGFLNKILGFEYSLYLCSFLLFAAFISVTKLPIVSDVVTKSHNIEKEFIGFFKKIFEGYEFIKGNRTILFPVLLLILVQVILAMITVSVPNIAIHILKISVDNAGIVLVVPAGIGAVLGVIGVPVLLKKGIRKRRIIKYSMLLCIASFMMVSLIMQNYPLFIRLILMFLIAILMGISFVGIVIPSQTFLQEKTPGGLRGRVFGNFWFLSTLVTVVPVVFSGTITEIFGVKTMFIIIAGFLLFALILFENRKIGNLRIS